MKFRLSSLLLGLCIALASVMPAQAKSNVQQRQPAAQKVAPVKASAKRGVVLKVSGRKATAQKVSVRSGINLGQARLGMARKGQARRYARYRCCARCHLW